MDQFLETNYVRSRPVERVKKVCVKVSLEAKVVNLNFRNQLIPISMIAGSNQINVQYNNP